MEWRFMTDGGITDEKEDFEIDNKHTQYDQMDSAQRQIQIRGQQLQNWQKMVCYWSTKYLYRK